MVRDIRYIGYGGNYVGYITEDRIRPGK